jgi:hypothetical protein
MLPIRYSPSGPIIGGGVGSPAVLRVAENRLGMTPTLIGVSQTLLLGFAGTAPPLYVTMLAPLQDRKYGLEFDCTVSNVDGSNPVIVTTLCEASSDGGTVFALRRVQTHTIVAGDVRPVLAGFAPEFGSVLGPPGFASLVCRVSASANNANDAIFGNTDNQQTYRLTLTEYAV